MLYGLTSLLIRRAERRLGVALDYTHKIAKTDVWLLMRYNRFLGFLDPRRHAPPAAYHTARLRGAVLADCGSCVAAEIALAKAAGVPAATISRIIGGEYEMLAEDLTCIATLADSVVGRREDDPDNRDAVRARYGEAGLIELGYAMNGATLLPGLKRTMGYATSCDLELASKLAAAEAG